MDIITRKKYEFKYLSIMSMISVTFLISAMIFTYRIIEIGPFLTPGGVIPFAITYLMAGIITEVYGYKNARKVIFGNFFCIFLFNINVSLLLKLPIPTNATMDYFSIVFGSALFIMTIYSIGFLFGDMINAFVISKYNVLLKGRYFYLRLIGASIIGQIIFSIIVIPSLYFHMLDLNRLLQQFCTTIAAKLLIILIFSPLCSKAVYFLRKIEKIDSNQPEIVFNPFIIKQS